MREFNTSGPCNPALHYTVMREDLIAEGKEKVYKGRYFTIFAPRQSGKTTYFQLLLNELKGEGFTPIWISFEELKTITRTEFYEIVNHYLHHELAKQEVKVDYTIKNHLGLGMFLELIKDQQIVLVIDEFEGIPDERLSEVMHTFRRIYHKQEDYALQSLILVGVSTVAELILSTASPFNVADELQITYFTFEEVEGLINQYVTETEQRFEQEVIQAIYHNTAGQPGLVCALCQHLVTEVVTDKSQSVTMEDFFATLTHFLTRRQDRNILNIVQKAREKQALMLKILFGDHPIEFSIDVPDIAWLYAHGVVDMVDGYVAVPVPLYAKRLIKAFSPVINGEVQNYLTSAQDNFDQYLNQDGSLNINALLASYRAYVRRRGFRAFDTENLKEGAWHYSLDGYINFFIEGLEGQTYIEVPSTRGRTDILIRHRNRSYIIETKIYSTPTRFKQGKSQLAAYVTSEGLAEGYYVVFSRHHTETDNLVTEEVITGKRIYTHIILINFEPPSRLAIPEELK